MVYSRDWGLCWRETFDKEDTLENCQEEIDEEKEFGTIGDDEGKPVIHINMIVLV